MPPKTTFGGPKSREGQRITTFMEEIAPLLAARRNASPLGIELDIGVPSGQDLLVQHDLDNFLEPLATHLGPARIDYARATKSHGPVSTLRLGTPLGAGNPTGAGSP